MIRKKWFILMSLGLLSLVSLALASPALATKHKPPVKDLPSVSVSKPKEPPCGFETDTPVGTDPGVKASPGSQIPGLVGAFTELKVHPTTGAIGEKVWLKATLRLMPDGTPVPNHRVHFWVGGVLLGGDHTDAKGEARVAYKVPNAVGPSPIRAEFAGTPKCIGAKGDATFTPVKASTKMTLELLNPKQALREGHVLSASGKIVRTTDQAGLDGREILVKVAGQALPTKAATSPNGTFSFSYTIPKGFGAKTAKLEARFAGDPLYKPTVASLNFTVQPPPPPPVKAYLKWEGAKGMVGQTVTVEAWLSRSPDKSLLGLEDPIPGREVRLWYEYGPDWDQRRKHLGEATTDSKGRATITYKIDDKPGKYHIQAAVGDWTKYGLAIEKLSNPLLTVEKAPVQVSILGPSSAKIGDTLQLKVRVTRTTDGAPAANVPVSVSDKKTNDQGEVAFTYNVTTAGGTGPRTVQVSTKATDWYLAGSGSKVIQVSPKTN